MNLSDFRNQYPQYNDMSDSDLVDALHTKYYSDLDKSEVESALGVSIGKSSDDEITGAASSIFDFSDNAPEAIHNKAIPERTIGGTAQDIAVTAGKGLLGLAETGVGLTDLATEGAAGKYLDEHGYGLKAEQEKLDSYYSDAQKAANQNVENADGFVDTTKAMLENPSTIAKAAVESLPSMMVGGALGRGLSATSKIAPYLAGAAGEGAVTAGQQAEGIRQQTEDGYLTPKQSALAVASGIGTGVIGAAAGKVAAKFGLTDIDTLAAGGDIASTNTSVLKRVLGGAISEGALEEMPQSAQEKMLENLALDKDPFEGVGTASAAGLLTGGLMGGSGGLLHRGINTNDTQPASPLDDTTAPEGTTPLGETIKADEAMADNTPLNDNLGNLNALIQANIGALEHQKEVTKAITDESGVFDDSVDVDDTIKTLEAVTDLTLKNHALTHAGDSIVEHEQTQADIRNAQAQQALADEQAKLDELSATQSTSDKQAQDDAAHIDETNKLDEWINAGAVLHGNVLEVDGNKRPVGKSQLSYVQSKIKARDEAITKANEEVNNSVENPIQDLQGDEEASAVNQFTPTHTLDANSTPVQLKQDSDGNDYFVDENGDEYDTSDPHEAITRQIDDAAVSSQSPELSADTTGQANAAPVQSEVQTGNVTPFASYEEAVKAFVDSLPEKRRKTTLSVLNASNNTSEKARSYFEDQSNPIGVSNINKDFAVFLGKVAPTEKENAPEISTENKSVNNSSQPLEIDEPFVRGLQEKGEIVATQSNPVFGVKGWQSKDGKFKVEHDYARFLGGGVGDDRFTVSVDGNVIGVFEDGKVPEGTFPKEHALKLTEEYFKGNIPDKPVTQGEVSNSGNSEKTPAYLLGEKLFNDGISDIQSSKEVKDFILSLPEDERGSAIGQIKNGYSTSSDNAENNRPIDEQRRNAIVSTIYDLTSAIDKGHKKITSFETGEDGIARNIKDEDFDIEDALFELEALRDKAKKGKFKQSDLNGTYLSQVVSHSSFSMLKDEKIFGNPVDMLNGLIEQLNNKKQQNTPVDTNANERLDSIQNAPVAPSNAPVFRESLEEFEANDPKAYALPKSMSYLAVDPTTEDARDKLMSFSAEQLKDYARRNGVTMTGSKESVVNRVINKRKAIAEIKNLGEDFYSSATKSEMKALALRAGIKISGVANKQQVADSIRAYPDSFKKQLTDEIVKANYAKKALKAHKEGASIHYDLLNQLKPLGLHDDALVQSGLGKIRVSKGETPEEIAATEQKIADKKARDDEFAKSSAEGRARIESVKRNRENFIDGYSDEKNTFAQSLFSNSPGVSAKLINDNVISKDDALEIIKSAIDNNVANENTRTLFRSLNAESLKDKPAHEQSFEDYVYNLPENHGKKRSEIVEDHYRAIESHIEKGGKISQRVFDSLDKSVKQDIAGKYGDVVAKQENQQPTAQASSDNAEVSRGTQFNVGDTVYIEWAATGKLEPVNYRGRDGDNAVIVKDGKQMSVPYADLVARNEPEKHYSEVILDTLVDKYGWKRSEAKGFIEKDVGGNTTEGTLNTKGTRIITASFDTERSRYLTAYSGFDEIVQVDGRGDIADRAKEFNYKVNTWARKNAVSDTVKQPVEKSSENKSPVLSNELSAINEKIKSLKQDLDSKGAEYPSEIDFMKMVDSGEKQGYKKSDLEQKLVETITQLRTVKASPTAYKKVVGGRNETKADAVAYLEREVANLESAIESGGFFDGTNMNNYLYLLRQLKKGSENKQVDDNVSKVDAKIDTSTPAFDYTHEYSLETLKELGVTPDINHPELLQRKAQLEAKANESKARKEQEAAAPESLANDFQRAMAAVKRGDIAEAKKYLETLPPIQRANVEVAITKKAKQDAEKQTTAPLDEIDAEIDGLLDELGAALIGRLSMKAVPENNVEVMPIMAKLMGALAKKGYLTFKENAKQVLTIVRAKFGDKIADTIDIEDLQGGYIAMSRHHEGTTNKRDVVMFESIDELFVEDETEQQDDAVVESEPTTENESIGNTISLSTPKQDMRVNARYEVVNDGTIITSHDTQLRVNSRFPQELQPRNRSAKSYEIDLQNKVANFNPERVGQSATTDSGAPIVDAKGNVISGNGRAIAIKKLSDKSYSDYKQWLMDNADEFGLDAAVIAKMPRPVLVRRLTDNDVNLGELARKSNDSSIKEMSVVEQAFSDADSIDEETFTLYDGGSLTTNRSFVTAFINATGADNIYDAQGMLSQKGMTRIESAIMAKAYGDETVVADLYENADTEVKSLLNALLKSSANWLKLRAVFSETNTKDLTQNLTEAVMLVKKARMSGGQTVKSLLSQRDLMSGDSVSPLTEKFVKLFFYDENLSKYIAADKVAEILNAVSQNMAKSLVNTDVFGDNLTPPQILDKVYEQYIKARSNAAKGQGGLFDGFSPFATRGDKRRETESRQGNGRQGTDSAGVKDEGREVINESNLVIKGLDAYKNGEKNVWIDVPQFEQKRKYFASEGKQVYVTVSKTNDGDFVVKLNDISKSPLVKINESFPSEDDALRFAEKEGNRVLNKITGNTNVPSANTDLERNSGITNSANERNETPVLDGSTGNADLLGQTSEPVKSTENVANSDKLDPISIALTGGASSNNELLDGNETNVIAPSDARDSDSGRSGQDSIKRMDAKRDGSNPIKELPAKSVKGLAPKQVKHVEADLENVKEAMPFLNEGQAADVVFAEKRLAEHKGVMFCNSTGTGKTFSGLGIVSRYVNQGKNNILIVAPSQNILDSWTKAAKNYFGLDVSLLEDKGDAGKGVVATTYANFGDNPQLVNREWDLIVTDEAHYLMSNSAGTNTASLEKLRGLTKHESGFYAWFNSKNHELVTERTKLKELSKSSDKTGYDEKRHEEVDKEYAVLVEAAREEWKTKENKTKTVMLSATPFAYESNIDYANGYLFDYDKADGSAYNSGGGKERFFMQHLGYRMRYNKLTQPDAKVDRSTMQRQFNEMLKKSGALSARSLDVPFDYDRQFILVESAIGNEIDRALQWVSDNNYRELSEKLNKRFDHLTRRYLLEAIKAKEIIPIVKAHLAAGRKVLVFHDYKKGGTSNPFVFQSFDTEKLNEQWHEFASEFPTLISYQMTDLLSKSPIETFEQEFGKDALIYNGDVSSKDRIARVAQFNDDNSGKNLILLQSASAKEGVSFHDTTGVHQRVLINIGLPTAPTTAIQQEGRIYRVGQKSDAIFRYVNTGTNWERWAFAQTIAGRASAAENLALGEGARGLRDAFINAFENSDSYPAGHEGEGKGGKDADKQAYRAMTEMDRAKGFYYATQKKNSRTKAAEGTDYFATPEPVGMVMTRLADARAGEKMLEPSAGHGAIARWFRTDAERTAIEPSSELNSRLALVFQDGDIKRQTFEDLNIVNKYDAIVMNPPFGTGGKTAIEHLEKAFNHLRDGGRVVALIPEGAMADKRLDAWLSAANADVKPLISVDGKGDIFDGDTIVYKDFVGKGRSAKLGEKKFKVASVVYDHRGEPLKLVGESESDYVYLIDTFSVKPTGERPNTSNKQLVADISLPTVTFERAGTKVKTHIVVIEKTTESIQTKNVDYSGINDINELFDKIDGLSVQDRLKPVEEVAETVAAAQDTESKATKAEATLVEGKHTKTGEAIFTVKLPHNKEAYAGWNSEAKKHGGFYSRFTGGFLFKTKDAANKFMSAVGGNAESANETPAISTPEKENFDNYVNISADSLASLRKIDLDRVLEQASDSERAKFARYITSERPDLFDEVDAIMKEDYGKEFWLNENNEIKYSYAGQRAQNADKSALARAVQMEQEGVDNETIRKETGWFLGFDDKWKFEISDKAFTIKDFEADFDETDKRSFNEGGRIFVRLDKVLKHAKLEKAYPDLFNDIYVEFNPDKKMASASFSPASNVAEVGARYLKDGTIDFDASGLLHELQHAIQKIEGFAFGGSNSVQAWADAESRKILIDYSNKKLKELSPPTYEDFWGAKKTPEGEKAYQDYLTTWHSKEYQKSLVDAIQKGAAAEVYQLLAGEIEARDTQSRMNLTDAQRREQTPYVSQGISKEDAIVRFGDGVANSEAAPTETHTTASFLSTAKSALDAKFGKGWFERLWGTGSFEAISDAEAQRIVGSKSTIEAKYSKDGKIEAFYNPADDKVYFVPENISKDRDVAQLALHEIGVHMMRLGQDQEEFDSILADVKAKRESNPLIKAAYEEAKDADTKAEHMDEEALARLIDKHPELKLSQRFIAWFKKAVRGFAKRFKGADKLAFIKWANKLDEKDWVYLANSALRTAPEKVGFKGDNDPNGGIRLVMLSRVPSDAPVLKVENKVTGTIQEMRNQAKEYARTHFAGTKVHNNELNADITISMSGIKHTLSGNSGEKLVKSVFITPEILQEGIYIGNEPEKKGNKSILKHHYLAVKLEIDGEVHDVVADIREMADGHFYYDHSFERNNASESLPSSNTEQSLASKSEDLSENISNDAKFSKSPSPANGGNGGRSNGNNSTFESADENNPNFNKAKPVDQSIKDDLKDVPYQQREEVQDWLMKQANKFKPVKAATDYLNKKVSGLITTMGTLPERDNYLIKRYQTLGRLDTVDDLVTRVFNTISKASKEDSAAIYEYMTTKDASPNFIQDKTLREAAVNLKDVITTLGEKMVEKGLIPRESYEANKGAYLPRVYLKHIMGDDSFGLFKGAGSGKSLSDLGYTKKRKDIPEEVRRLWLMEVKNPAYLASRSISVTMRDIAMMNFFDEIANNKQWVWNQSTVTLELDLNTNMPTAIFDADGNIDYKATNSSLDNPKGKTTSRKVTPYFLLKEAERMREQSAAAPEEDRAEIRDLADMLESVAKKHIADMGNKGLPQDFIKMPDSARYGALRGLVIHKQIYDDIVGTLNTFSDDKSTAEKWLGENGILTQYVSAWKWTHVAINIPTQITNILSNPMLLHMSGVRFDQVPVRMIQAMREIIDDGEHYRILKEYGGRKASFSNQELRHITQWLIENEAEKGTGTWDKLAGLAMKVAYMAGSGVDAVSNFHQLMETWGKTAKVIDEMAKGATKENAALAAHEALFDYSLVSRNTKFLRNSPFGIPFMTWLVKSTEATAKTAINRPTKFLPYYTLFFILSALAAGANDVDDDDLDKLQKLLPEWMQEKGHAYFLPWRDEKGRWQAIDFAKFLPWGTQYELLHDAKSLVIDGDPKAIGKAMHTAGLFGSPVLSVVTAITTGIDPFTRKPVVAPNSTPAETVGSWLKYAWNLSAPPMLGMNESSLLSTFMNSGELDKHGDPKKTTMQAIAKIGGLNITSVDPVIQRAEQIQHRKNQITSLKARRTHELKDPNLTFDEKKEITMEYNEKIKRAIKDMQDFSNETKVSANAAKRRK